jgi:hypothetical protein
MWGGYGSYRRSKTQDQDLDAALNAEGQQLQPEPLNLAIAGVSRTFRMILTNPLPNLSYDV